MNKFLKAIRNPAYTLHILNSRYLKIYLKEQIFPHSQEYRSESEKQRGYSNSVLKALKSQKLFDNFKQDYHYQETLEHVSKEQGREYLNILEARKDSLLDQALNSVLISDKVGNPIKFYYGNYKIPFSPTTLRYLKVASDIKLLFGESLGYVAEIGCGYGGQALVIDQLLNTNLIKLFDLPYVNKLIERYLNSFILRSAYKTAILNQETVEEYDLVISNFAFSELPKILQIKYIEKVISKSKKGYLTMNSGITGSNSIGKLSINDLKQVLPNFQIIKEEPLTSQNNYIIVWGYNKKTFKNFTERVILNS